MTSAAVEGMQEAVKQSPMDATLRMVYADSLEEDGSSSMASRQRNIAKLLEGPYMVSPSLFMPRIKICMDAMGYSGRKVKLVCVKEIEVGGRFNEWDEGSVTYRKVMYLLGDSNRQFDVHHSIFCGKDAGITILAKPDDLIHFLPEGTQLYSSSLSWEEKVVLAATRGLKSSYAGIKNYRFSEARRVVGISLQQWDEGKASCISKGFLNKAGAITPEGRNAIGNPGLGSLRK